MAQRTEPFPIPLSSFGLGGLADSAWSGMKNSMKELVGVDLHTIPGVVQARQKMKLDSGATVTEFCKWQLACSDGNTYHFSSETGKVWKRTSAGVWSLVYTMTAGAGEVKILGVAEYNGYIYIATELRLHRILVSALSNWTTGMVLNWATFTKGTKLFHPMFVHVQQAILYIGDANLIAQVEVNTFTANALDVKSPQIVSCMGPFGTDILVGTYVSDNVSKGEVYRWNGASVSWTSSAVIDEVGVNVILPSTNYTLIQAGRSGRFFYYQTTATGDQLVDYKKIPGVYGPSNYMKMNPDASGNLQGLILAGISNGLGDPCLEGVYMFGRYASNYPTVLDLSFPLSPRSDAEDDTSFVLSGIEIGSVLVSGFNVFVSWKRTVGETITTSIDSLDWSNKLNGAYLRSRATVVDRGNKNNFCEFNVATADLPDNTAVNILTRVNYENDVSGEVWRDVGARVDDGNKLVGISKVIPANVLETKYKLTTSGNSSPLIESAVSSIKPNG